MLILQALLVHLWRTTRGRVTSRSLHNTVLSRCCRYNFTGADQQKKVEVLSGGERNRLHLAKVGRAHCNALTLGRVTGLCLSDRQRSSRHLVQVGPSAAGVG